MQVISRGKYLHVNHAFHLVFDLNRNVVYPLHNDNLIVHFMQNKWFIKTELKCMFMILIILNLSVVIL